MRVTIVGAGPAGLTTAIAIRHADPRIDVVVLEKERFPREKICAGAIGLRGDRALETMGVKVDVPSAVVRGMSLATRFGERAHRESTPIGRVIRRIEFDAALAGEARKRGVTILEGARVEASDAGVLRANGERIGGIVVGADGVGSIVRRSMGIGPGERALHAQVLEVDTASVPGDRDRTFVHFDLASPEVSGYFWDFPTRLEGADLMSRGVYVLGGDRGRGELEDRLGERLRRLGIDLGACTKKRFAERGFSHRERVTADDRILVGEAAGIDPSTGEGIAPAIEMGALAGRFLVDVVRGARSLADWSRVLARSPVGWDLRVRTRAARALYGSEPTRRSLEHLLDRPLMMRVGCAMFSGARPRATDVPRLAVSVAQAWLQSRATGPATGS